MRKNETFEIHTYLTRSTAECRQLGWQRITQYMMRFSSTAVVTFILELRSLGFHLPCSPKCIINVACIGDTLKLTSVPDSNSRSNDTVPSCGRNSRVRFGCKLRVGREQGVGGGGGGKEKMRSTLIRVTTGREVETWREGKARRSRREK